MERLAEQARTRKPDEKCDNVEESHRSATPDAHESLKAKHAFDPAF